LKRERILLLVSWTPGKDPRHHHLRIQRKTRPIASEGAAGKFGGRERTVGLTQKISNGGATLLAPI